MKIAVSKLKHHPVSQDFYGVTEKEDLNNLIGSMGAHGLRRPVWINQKNQIIDGNRRVAVARLLGWKFILAIRKKYKSQNDEVKEIIDCNVTRKQTTSMKLRQVRRLYKIYGVGQGARHDLEKRLPHDEAKHFKPVNARKTISGITGVSEGNIQKMLFIDERAPEMFKDIDAGKISLNKAEQMLQAREKESKGQPKLDFRNDITFMSESVRMATVWYPLGDNNDYSYSDKIVEAFLKAYEENKKQGVGGRLGETFASVLNSFEEKVDEVEKKARNQIYSQLESLEREIKSGRFNPHRAVSTEIDGGIIYQSSAIGLDEFLQRFGAKKVEELKEEDLEFLVVSTASYFLSQNPASRKGIKKVEPFLVALPTDVQINFGDYPGPLVVVNYYSALKVEQKIALGKFEKGEKAKLIKALNEYHYENIRREIRKMLGYYSPSTDQTKHPPASNS